MSRVEVIATGSTMPRLLEDRFSDVVNLKDYGAGIVGDGEDVTDALQAAATSAGTNGTTVIPRGLFTLSDTIYFPPNAAVVGPPGGRNQTRLYRTGDYGNTFQAGDDTTSGGGFTVRDLWLWHGAPYTRGDTALSNKAVHGSHLAIYGSQDAVVENCRFWRMPYSVYFHGGTLPYLNNNSFLGVWDHLYPECQEGIASVVFDVHAHHGHPQIAEVTNNGFYGAISAPRAVAINGHTVTMSENIGPQYGVMVYGLECGHFSGGIFGGQNQSGLAICNKAGSVVSSISISGVEFDAARSQGVLIRTQDAAAITRDLSISGCSFIGELNGFHGIDILDCNGAPSLYAATINNNTFKAQYGSCFLFTGWNGGSFSHNTMTAYNGLNIGANDAQFTSAGIITGACKNLSVANNIVGGGGSLFLPAGNPSNYCNHGIIIDAATGITQTGTIDAGVNGGI